VVGRHAEEFDRGDFSLVTELSYSPAEPTILEEKNRASDSSNPHVRNGYAQTEISNSFVVSSRAILQPADTSSIFSAPPDHLIRGAQECAKRPR
jgi:hypothetical protein